MQISAQEAARVLAAETVAARVSAMPTAGGHRPQAGAAAGGADGVSLSAAAQSVSGWMRTLRSLPDVRPEQVAEARARLQSGQLASPRQVAQLILRRLAADRAGGLG